MTQEGPATVEERLFDYRDVDGVKIPFRTESWANGKKVSAQTVKTLQLNPEAKEELFKVE